jgi:hypothetical protein
MHLSTRNVLGMWTYHPINVPTIQIQVIKLEMLQKQHNNRHGNQPRGERIRGNISGYMTTDSIRGNSSKNNSVYFRQLNQRRVYWLEHKTQCFIWVVSWVRISPMTRCTRYNIVWLSWSVGRLLTCPFYHPDNVRTPCRWTLNNKQSINQSVYYCFHW